MTDGELLDEMQASLSCFECHLEHISTESSGGYTSGYLTHRPRTVIKLMCTSPANFLKLVECASAYNTEMRSRQNLLAKYPAAKEAYEHYKSIEALCSGK